MACPYSNAGYDKCHVTHLTPQNWEEAYYFCRGGGQYRRCEIYPELVARDVAALEKKSFLGNGPALLPEPHFKTKGFFFQKNSFSTLAF